MSVMTKTALANSLKKLLAKKNLDKITVKDITDDCGLNRQTFYYHFHDVYDLVEWILIDEVNKYVQEGITDGKWKESIRKLTDGLAKEKSFMMNIYYSLDRRQLDGFIQKVTKPLLRVITDQAAEGKDISEEDKSYIVDIATYALGGVVSEWIASGMIDSIGIRIEKLFVIMDGMLEYTLDKFDRNLIGFSSNSNNMKEEIDECGK